MITPSPSTQSCATCTTAISRQSAPTTVTPLPVTVPRWMLQCSRTWVRGPISQRVGSPRYFRSCGGSPTVQNGCSTASAPIRVWPATTTWLTRLAPASMTASAPTWHQGPMLTPAAMLAPGSTMAVGWIIWVAQADGRGD